MISTLIALDRVLPSLTTGAVGEASSLPSFQRLSVLAVLLSRKDPTSHGEAACHAASVTSLLSLLPLFAHSGLCIVATTNVHETSQSPEVSATASVPLPTCAGGSFQARRHAWSVAVVAASSHCSCLRVSHA